MFVTRGHDSVTMQTFPIDLLPNTSVEVRMTDGTVAKGLILQVTEGWLTLHGRHMAIYPVDVEELKLA